MMARSTPRRPPLALQLLAFAATRGASAVALDDADDREVRWLLDGGLGAMLHRAVAASPSASPGRWSDTLLAADLTAQVADAQRRATLLDVVDTAAGLGIPVTLLKGMSVSTEHYRPSHLRPMNDIDVLVPAGACDPLQEALQRRGYRGGAAFDPASCHKHGPPLQHPDRGVWVEVHRALFDGLHPRSVFGAEHLALQSRSCLVEGRRVHRLSPALQLLYLAFSWHNDLAGYNVNVHPTCLPALFDAVLLVSRERDWCFTGFHDRPDSAFAVACLHVMIRYLESRGLVSVPPPLAEQAGEARHVVGAAQLAIIHRVLDRYLVGGRPWPALVPLPVTGRYKPSYQARKRLRTGRFRDDQRVAR